MARGLFGPSISFGVNAPEVYPSSTLDDDDREPLPQRRSNRLGQYRLRSTGKPDSSLADSHRVVRAKARAVARQDDAPPRPRSGISIPTPPALIRSTRLPHAARSPLLPGSAGSSTQASVQFLEYLSRGDAVTSSGIVAPDAFPNLDVPRSIDLWCRSRLNTAQNPVGECQSLIRWQFHRLSDNRFHRFAHGFRIRLALNLSSGQSAPNAKDHRPRARDGRLETATFSRGSVHPLDRPSNCSYSQNLRPTLSRARSDGRPRHRPGN